MERRIYDAEFKANAVRLTQIGDRPVSAIAKELGIEVNVLYRWRREAAASGRGRQAFPGRGNNRDEELMRLQRKLRQAEMERDILKKAMTLFVPASR